MRMKLFVASLAGLMVLAVGSVRASDPMGVYALIEKVAIHPLKTTTASNTSPSVEIWGAFSFAVRRQPGGVMVKPAGGFGNEALGDVYGPVQTGYLFYICSPSDSRKCTNEWQDLQAVAGKGQVVGFGGRYVESGRVRPATEAPYSTSSDIYPLNMGVMPIGQYRSIFGGEITNRTTYPDLIAALGAALAKK